MPRTVPDIGAVTPDEFQVSLKWVDSSGDFGSDVISFPSAPLFANLEAFVVVYAISQNVNIYQVTYRQIWDSPLAVTDATAALRHSGKAVIHAIAKDDTNAAQDIYLRAPIEASFLTNTDTPNAAATELANTLAAWITLLGGTYAVNSLRFAGHVDKNKRVLV